MKRIALLLGVSAPLVAAAQTDSAFPISTNRPSYSNGTGIVPVGHPQIELGFTYTTLDGSHSLTIGEAMFRYALSDRFELEVLNGTYGRVTDGGTIEGMLDPQVGFKIKLVPGVYSGKNRTPEIAFVGQTTVPIGSAEFRVNRSQPTASLAWYYQVNANDGVGGNFNASDLGPSGSRFTEYGVSLYISHTINAKTGAFAEVYRLMPEAAGGPNANFADVGVTYLLNPRTQIDFRVGSGFNSGRDGAWFGAGVSYRF